jgi:hypothetical protein
VKWAGGTRGMLCHFRECGSWNKGGERNENKSRFQFLTMALQTRGRGLRPLGLASEATLQGLASEAALQGPCSRGFWSCREVNRREFISW